MKRTSIRQSRSFFRRFIRQIFRFALALLAISVIWVVIYRWVNPPVTVLQLIEGKTHPRSWQSLHDLGYEMPLAVIASEDQRFLKHNGFDHAAIQAAMEYNRNHERKIGASTLSQQTAKNVFLWPSRSWLRKGLEAWFTVLIEVFWSKERIMEVYLNVIEMGPQCFGAEAAAQRFFKKPAHKLSRREAALIAAALPHPKRSDPARPSAYLTKRGQFIEKQMRNLGGTQALPWAPSSGKAR